MAYEWDEEKNRLNQNKHGGISFELATTVFEDPNCLIVPDRIDETGEARWHAIGTSLAAGSRFFILLVVHVYRESEYGQEIIRIISARAASKNDIRRYQKSTLD